MDVYDHEPDALEITRARYRDGKLKIYAESDFAPGSDNADDYSPAVMTVSVDRIDSDANACFPPFLLEAPMTYNPRKDRYEFKLVTPVDLAGRNVSVQTDEGGSYNEVIRD